MVNNKDFATNDTTCRYTVVKAAYALTHILELTVLNSVNYLKTGVIVKYMSLSMHYFSSVNGHRLLQLKPPSEVNTSA